MKRLIIILTLLSVSEASVTQIEQLIELGGLTSSIQEAKSIDSTSDNEITTPENTADKDEIDPRIFLGDDFGFSGEENFDGKQKNKQFLSPLEYFGYSFFVNAPSTFILSNDLSVSNNYILGVGDTLQVILYGTKNQKFSLTISRDGDIFFPEIGPVSIASLTFGEAKTLITELVGRNILGTEVKIALSDIRSIDIFVLGEVFSPGLYTVSSLATLTNAIISSGGVKRSGSLRNIQLKRNGDLIQELDLYDLLLKGDTSKDSKLLPGDVVFIPPITKTVAVYGEVNRPAIYELDETENLAELLKYAGNLKPKANSNAIEIISIDNATNSFQINQVNINDNDLNDISLSSGDVIRIYSVNDDMKNAILFKGHAKNPGFFPLSDKNTRITDFIKSQDDLLSMTQSDYVLIKRHNHKNSNLEFFQIDLQALFLNPETEKNIVLLEKDEIIFLPKLLNLEQIQTRLIQDQYIVKGNQTILAEDTWESLTYLRKSLMEEELNTDEKNSINMSVGTLTDPTRSPDIRRYYEYSIHNYCFVPQSFAEKIIEQEEQAEQAEEITSLCRRQIIDPLLNVIEQQKTNSNLKKTVTIFGNVHFPGEYPFSDEMQIADLIKASGGLREGTFNAEIEITRRDVSGKTASFTNQIASSLSKKDMEIKLSPSDIITVKQIEKSIKTVNVSGEVYFSGVYPITEYETLSGLLKRTGGLTEFASIEGAVFQRQSLKETEIKRFALAQEELKKKLLLQANTSKGIGEPRADQDLSVLNALISSSEEINVSGRLVIDLEGILNGGIDDIVLEDGDTIYIPRRQQTVSVLGEVFAPNAHLYSEELSLDNYIQQSGGVNDYADDNNIYLIKADGSIVPNNVIASGFFRGKSSGLEPGDTIVVPLLVTPFSGIQATTEITQIIYQMAIAAAAVNSFSN